MAHPTSNGLMNACEEAIKKEFHVFQCEIEDLFIKEGHVYASSRNILSAGSTQVEGILKEDIKVSEFKYSFNVAEEAGLG